MIIRIGRYGLIVSLALLSLGGAGRREPEIAVLEALFTKETDPERAKNRQVSNTLRSGRG